MLLAIDVGNTNAVFGVFDGSTLLANFRLETREGRTYDEYGIWLIQLLKHHNINPQAIDGVIVSSVVPPLQFNLEKMSKTYFSVTPQFVGPGLKTGMPILYDNPREVGADRIVNAVAAFEKHHCALIVCDFGTATTFDAVSEKGEYLGGSICPGIHISMNALFENAAKLSRVEFQKPPKVIGKNTVHSMQSGLVFGYVSMVDGLCERMMKEMPQRPKIVATGGLAPLIAQESKMISEVDELLTLNGLKLIHERNV